MRGKAFYRIGLAMERESIFARRILSGIADAAAAFAREGVVLDLRFLRDRLLRNSDDLAPYDGFIAQIQDDAAAEKLSRTNRPVVDVLFKKAHPFCTIVNVDNAAIARLAAEHFLDRRFAHVAFCGREGVAYSDERHRAFESVLAERGVPCISYSVPSAKRKAFFMGREPRREEAVENPLDEEYLFDWAKTLPSGTAVFCCQDLRAYQLCHACYRAGLHIPNDIAILGVDDDPIFCSFSDPRLSSIDPDAESVGREALSVLWRNLKGEVRRSRTPPPRFVSPRGLTVRESTDLFHYDPPWLGEALAFISQRFAEPLAVEDVFAHVGKSHTLVDRAFRRVLGTSVGKEINRFRLDRASHLLRTTDLPVREVARQSGFTSIPYFCAAFRSRFGRTAMDYRALQIR